MAPTQLLVSAGMGGDRTAKALLEPGAQVDHYKVIRRIGVGGMGEVYLARDLRLGRPVALKLIAKAESYMVEQFMLEAKATARLNHPNIVTVYDIGEWRGVPYLALEYLEGSTLAERRRQQAFGPGELIRIGLAISDALAEAHRHGVLHRDLKPSNILFPKDGRLRVVDFGVAKLLVAAESGTTDPPSEATAAVGEARTVRLSPKKTDFEPEDEESSIPTVASPATVVVPGDDSGAEVARRGGADHLSVYNTGPLGFAGSPAYMAPEQWEQHDTRATDVWALGVILYEMVCGERPFDGPSADALRYLICKPEPVPVPVAFRDIPAELASCIMRCLSKRPEDRPTADEVRGLLEPLVMRTRHAAAGEGNPFRGLLAFTEQHADLFFGRDDEVTAFVERLRTTVIVPVVGPSGAGKSSFIRAGVIPRLREQSQWHVVRLRPGHQPFRILAGRLLADGSTASMVDAATTAAKGHGGRSRVASPESEEELATALRDAPGRLAVALGQIADRTGARVLLFIDQFEELYTLVEDPAEREAFLDAVTAAAADPLEPARVVFTLRDDFVGRFAVTRSAREVLGQVALLVSPGREGLRETLTGPLAAAGYEFDDPSLPDEMIAAVDGEPASLPLLQFTMRLLWERRDRIGKRLLRAEYEAIGGVGGALAEHADVVIEALDPDRIRLARDLLLRLVTPEGTRRVQPRGRLLDGLGPAAQEVLDRLVDSRLLAVRRGHAPEEDARIELAHESLIVAWQRLAWWLEDSREERRALGELVQAAELWERRGRRADELWQGDALGEAERTLGRVGERAPDVARAFVAAGVARRRQGVRRRRRFRVAALAGMMLATLASLAAAWLLSRKEKEARTAEERAEIERAQVLVESARAAFVRRDPLQARSKLRSALEIRDSVSGRGLWWQLEREPLLWRKSIDARLYDMDFSPDGRLLAGAAQSKLVYLFDTASLETRVLQGHGDQVLRVTYAPDGRHLASMAWNGELFLWDLATGRSRALSSSLPQSGGLAFSPDGRRLLSIGRNGWLRTFDVASGTEAKPIQVAKAVASAGFSRDRTAVAWVDEAGHATLWRVPDPRPWQTFERAGSITSAVAVSPEAGLVAWGEDDGTIRVFAIDSGREVRTLAGHTGRITGLSFDTRGRRLASNSWDETLRVWDLATGAQRVAPVDSGVFPNFVEFGPDGRHVATGGLMASLWTFDGEALPAPTGHQSPVYGLAISPDSTWIASNDIDGMVRLVDARSGAVRCFFHGHEGELRAAAFHPKGELLATAGVDRAIRLWTVPGCAPAGVLEGHERRVFDLAFSPDGRWLVSVSEDDSIRLWDFARRAQRAVLRGEPADVGQVAFSPDGDRFATVGFDGDVWLWQVDGRGEKVHPGAGASGVAFSPDGRRLAVAATDGVVRVLDIAGRRWREYGGFAGRLYDVAFFPDGKRVVIAASDKTARILDLETDARSALHGHDGELNNVKMDPAGGFIVTGGDDWTVRAWRAADGRPLWFSVGFTRTGETFGHRGWANLGPARPPSKAAWRAAVEARARSVSSAADHLCIATWDGRLEAWDLRRDVRLFERPGGARALAGASGCMALAGGEARLHTASGSRPVASGASAIAVDGSGWLVAAERGILSLAGDGSRRQQLAGAAGATVLVRVGDAIVVGYQDGIVERRARSGAPLLMDDTPSSPVTALIAGPAPGTVAAGFANGTLGVWDVRSAVRLERMQLHGPVVHLAMEGGRLDAATDLGDQAAYDLRVFGSEYCALLRDIWRQVPTRWGEGAPRTRAAPTDHPCAPR